LIIFIESDVRDSYSEFIRGIEDCENRLDGSPSGLWNLFNPIYTALANSRPSSTRKEEWARDLILAYRNVDSIKINLLDYLKVLLGDLPPDEKNPTSPLDEL